MFNFQFSMNFQFFNFQNWFLDSRFRGNDREGVGMTEGDIQGIASSLRSSQ
jgi:hypothetical protein